MPGMPKRVKYLPDEATEAPARRSRSSKKAAPAKPAPEAPSPEAAEPKAAPEPAPAPAAPPPERPTETRREANEKVVRALLAARLEDDQEALRRLLADEIALILPGEEPIIGR